MHPIAHVSTEHHSSSLSNFWFYVSFPCSVPKKVDPKKPQFNSGLVVEKASCNNDETVAKHGSLLRNKVTKLHLNGGRPNGHATDHSSCQLDLTSLVMANGENRQVQGMSDFRQKQKIVTW